MTLYKSVWTTMANRDCSKSRIRTKNRSPYGRKTSLNPSVAFRHVSLDSQYDLIVNCDADVWLHVCSEFYGEFKSRPLISCNSIEHCHTFGRKTAEAFCENEWSKVNFLRRRSINVTYKVDGVESKLDLLYQSSEFLVPTFKIFRCWQCDIIL
jgi:hypothetical protein